MFNKAPSTSGLEYARVQALKELENTDVSDPAYAKLVDTIDKLSKLITAERREPLNINTVALALGNLGGILTIVAYEQRHVFGSQAAKFIGKFR